MWWSGRDSTFPIPSRNCRNKNCLRSARHLRVQAASMLLLLRSLLRQELRSLSRPHLPLLPVAAQAVFTNLWMVVLSGVHVLSVLKPKSILWMLLSRPGT